MAWLSDEDDVRALHFFFQAEDGIRDRTVTGVQTCALPISAQHRRQRLERGAHDVVLGLLVPQRAPRGLGVEAHQPRLLPLRSEALAHVSRPDAPRRPELRSEERRVGKEGRSWWSA